MNHQKLLLDHLDLVDQIVRTTGRRRHLSHSELEDLSGFVRLRLLENDCEILRKFQHRSSFWTYLTTVIERMSMDFCVELWGRWRPSTMAERLGPAAVLIERLVTRDDHSLEEAIAVVRANHAVGLTEQELRDMWRQLPPRSRPQQVGEEAAGGLAAADSAESNVEDAAHQAEIERVEHALASALERCSDQERVLLAFRFNEGLGIAEIGELMGMSAPTLHRRLSKVLRELQVALEAAGVSREDVPRLIGHQAISFAPLLHTKVERLSGRARLFKQDG